MYEDINTYFFNDVVASYEEYKTLKDNNKTGKSRDLRGAISAAVALYHLQEHLPEGVSLSRNQIEDACPEYKFIGNIANVAKHKHLDKHSPIISDVSQLMEVTTVTKYVDELGPYQSVEKDVVADLGDGVTKSVSELLTTVINFWFAKLYSLKLISKSHQYKMIERVQPIPRSEAGDGRLDLQITQGVNFRAALHFRQYNYEKRMLEPIDLNGAQIEANIYRL
jgi:hypothetical protein